MGRLLFDISGLCQWYGFLDHPSGIQRVVERILCSAPLCTYPSVELIARAPGAQDFYGVDLAVVTALAQPTTRRKAIARLRRQFAEGMRLARLGGLGRDFRWMHVPYWALGWSGLSFLLEGRYRRGDPSPTRRVAPLTDQDVIVGLGDFWCHEGHATALAALATRSRARLVHMVHDLFGLDHPGWTHPYFGRLFARSLAQLAPHVDLWLANSRFVAGSLASYLERGGMVGGPIDVVPMGWDHFDTTPAPHDAEILRRHGLRHGAYLLHVGTVEPRKGIEILLRAARRVATKNGRWPIPCLLIGREGWRSQTVRAELRTVGQDSVRWLRDVPDMHLPAIYRGARFSVVPSLGEGWGFAVQESLAQGTPCIASRVGAIPEVGGDLVTYAEPGDIDGLAMLIERWSSDDQLVAGMRAEIAEKLRRQRPLPSWDAAGAQILKSAASGCTGSPIRPREG